jgi:alpha,alpha-trehalose phosphorylase
VIPHPAFEVDPWTVRETRLDLDMLAQSESIFALSNGHIGLRANLDEGEPSGLLGTYINGCYEARPLPYPEGGYGYPEAGQTVVNVTDGKVIRLLVDDEPFDLRYGKLLAHERVFDLRAGVLRRRAEWESPAGRSVRVSSTRLVSFTQRAVAAILYEVEPLGDKTTVVVQSELVANEPLPAQARDPRTGAPLTSPLRSEQFVHNDKRVVLVHMTAASALRLAAGMDHFVDGADGTETSTYSDPDLGRLTVAADLEPGQRLRIVKFLAYGWSADRSAPALRGQVEAALAAARLRGWDGLLTDQRSYLDDFWNRADVQLEGDAELQQAVRFALFHVLQSAARAEQRAVPAKGLTGSGYDGHTFWDTETFVLPVLTYTAPHAVADQLRWRHKTLPLALERARLLGLAGAAFPWRTIRGEECSGYWPASTAAMHINADIADAVIRYRGATGDDAFELEVGLELLVETARLWRAVGHHDREGQFRIDGVTGPDEYSAIADNNVYTNLMAQRNLRAAAEAAERHPTHAARLGVDAEETSGWRDAAETMFVPFDEALGVHPQAEGFTRHQPWDFASTGADRYPLMLHFPYFDLYRKQVVKQADLVLAMHLRGDAFTDAQKVRNFAYYDAMTVRDSSLSACTQAVMAAEVGQVELAYDYLGEAALMDLADLEHNVRDGVHIGSLAGAWLAVVAGLGGMRDHGGALSFAPRLPAALRRLVFRLTFLGRLLQVEVNHREVTYTLREGPALDVTHHGETVTVGPDSPVTRPVPALRAAERPAQPPGRQPARRRGS